MVTYKEHIVKKQKNAKDFVIFLIAPFLCVLCAYIITFLFFNIIPFFNFLIPLVWVSAIYTSARILLDRNIEFEYLLVDSDLDVDMIKNKSRRKRVISVYRKEILIMAPAGSDSLTSYLDSAQKVYACVSPLAEGTYVLIAKQGETKKALFFSPTEEMLEIMEKRNLGKVFRS